MPSIRRNCEVPVGNTNGMFASTSIDELATGLPDTMSSASNVCTPLVVITYEVCQPPLASVVVVVIMLPSRERRTVVEGRDEIPAMVTGSKFNVASDSGMVIAIESGLVTENEL